VEFDTAGADEPADAVVPEPLPPVDTFTRPPIDPGELIGEIPSDPPPINPGADRGSGAGTHILQGRDPSTRAQRALQEGGTIASEAAVARGLIWLAKHQNPDGSWSLHGFQSAGNCNGQCSDPGSHSDTAGTALALLPFLGAGQTHLEGQYREQVQTGLEWLVRNQESNGDLRGRGIGHMYAHAQCAIVLCEAYALTRDDWLRSPAQRSINFIVEAQHRAGGWRYSPGEAGDTSVVGWQLMALRSAQMAYLDVPDDVFEKANRFLDSVQEDRYGGVYAYRPGNGASAAMSAEALLCRQYYGWPRDHRGLQVGCEVLLQDYMPRKRAFDIYYAYYATQVMHHMQGDYFKTWNDTVRDMLVEMQETRGHQAGSWTPTSQDHFNRTGGRLYWTSLALCSLEVYYRHLPLYGRSAIGD
jgi:Squalene-hopene cyclase C-terminal domain